MDPNDPKNNPAPPTSNPNQQIPPQQPTGMPGAPGFPAQQYGYQPKHTNTMAIVAIILTFVMPVIGLVIGIIALSQIKKTGEEGKILAIIAIVLNALQLVFFVLFFVLFVIFADEISEFEDNFDSLETSEVDSTPETVRESSRSQARDTERQLDIQATRVQLEAYYAQNGYYPAVISTEIFPGLDPSSLDDPLSGDAYQYDTSPTGCQECESFVLSAELEDGSLYTEESLN